jgi:beta-glucosidase
VHLNKGQKVALSVNYGSMGGGPSRAQFIWAKVNNAPSPEALAAAKNAEVVIAVVGITSELEGKEIPVNEPGFLGGDRTSLDLPEPEEALLEAVAATGRPLVVVLMNGSAPATPTLPLRMKRRNAHLQFSVGHKFLLKKGIT